MSAAKGDEGLRLPSGAHGITPDLVTRNQRERLFAAVAETCAEQGYTDTSVADLTARAGVSTATFYKLFTGKRECVLEAHRELLGRLLAEVDAACAGQAAEEKVREGVRTILGLLAADAPTARLLTLEIVALGKEGVERNDATIEALVGRLRAARKSGEGDPSSPTDWVLVAGASMLIGRRVIAGEAASLLELEDELVALVNAL